MYTQVSVLYRKINSRYGLSRNFLQRDAFHKIKELSSWRVPSSTELLSMLLWLLLGNALLPIVSAPYTLDNAREPISSTPLRTLCLCNLPTHFYLRWNRATAVQDWVRWSGVHGYCGDWRFWTGVEGAVEVHEQDCGHQESDGARETRGKFLQSG